MNTSGLQAFAAEARVALMKAVRARLDAAMEPDSAARVDNPNAFEKLSEEIQDNGGGEQGRVRTAERHAYRWFNRIIALRYMDVNDFTGLHVVSGQDTGDVNALPEVLSAAKRGEFDEDVFDSAIGAKSRLLPTITALLDGSRSSNDPQGEAYGLLLRAYCDYWHRFLPFMFDEAGAADELLMPADLLASDSVLRRAVEVMTVDDCVGDGGRGNVEIIGWLYQFYIAERKSEVMDGFKKSKKAGAAEIPAATQLFTPDWIVRYLVQNTVGRLWVRNHPESRLWKHWEYYIAPGADDAGESLRIDSPEELTVCDPACGSGHMLTYAFDLLYDIYDEAGYSANEIPGLILKHNLYGMEIDERAANLASFALTMKARGRYRRFFRKGRQVQPSIQHIASERFTDSEVDELNELYDVTLDADSWNTYQSADVYGSLIQPDIELATLSDNITHADTMMLFDEHLIERGDRVLAQTACLARRYAVVVANPPYMGSGNMGAELKKYVQDQYKDGKADLFAAFMLRNLRLIQPNALLGMITMQSWMFLSSFDSLRKNLLAKHSIETMVHLGAGAFDSIGGEVVSTAAFTIRNGQSDGKGTYLRLVDVQGDANQAAACSRLLGASHESAMPASGNADTEPRMFTVDQHDFTQIPGSPIVYWLSDAMRKTFTMGKPLEKVAKPRQGLATADNSRFIREWWEVAQSRSSFDCTSHEEAATNGKRWFPCNKGGSFRRWYGNAEEVINWERDGIDLIEFKPKSVIRNPEKYFSPSVSWSLIGSGEPSFRYYAAGNVIDHASGSFYGDVVSFMEYLSILNSSFATVIMSAIAPTLNANVGLVEQIPLISNMDEMSMVDSLITVSRSDWDSSETSWDFSGLEVLGKDYPSASINEDALNNQNSFSCCQSAAGGSLIGGNRELLLAEQIPAYIEHCKNVAEEQRQREIRNNEMVADVYGVRDEVPCDVPIERVSLKRNPAFVYPKAAEAERDANMTVDVVKEIISYAVGCMFGRYSLDKPGLVLASQGETVEDYLAQVPEPSFMPDADNVIPITDEEWFEDDIVSRFRDFLAVTCGETHVNENIAYIEDVLGKSLRKYFAGDFYDDHIKMYKNRPIYWMYSSTPTKKGAFKALVYLHRYTPATTNMVLKYLREFTAKLNAQSEALLASAKPAQVRKGEKLRAAVKECVDYERDTLYPLATRNLPIDLDDGVLVNYLRLGTALRTIPAIEKKRSTVQSWTWPTHPLEG